MDSEKKEKQESQSKTVDLVYFEKVDLMFQTYEKSLCDCICLISDSIKVASSFETHFQSHIYLMNLLNAELIKVQNFLSKYKRLHND
jgi:hypothetical protein